MTAEKQKKIIVATSVDVRGTHSPATFLEIKRAFDSMNSGEIMEVLSADEGTKHNIPGWCVKNGHEYMGSVDERGFFKVFLMKGFLHT